MAANTYDAIIGIGADRSGDAPERNARLSTELYVGS
jgi:hypothetical protein